MFPARKPGVVVNLYSNGKVVIAGGNVALITLVQDLAISLGAQKVAKEEEGLEPLVLPFPHIGTDEVGKGD